MSHPRSLPIGRAWRGYLDSARLFGESCRQKNWGAIRGKSLHGNRKIVIEWTIGVVDVQGQLTQSTNVPTPETKYKRSYKRSKNVISVTSIVLKLVHICAQPVQLPVQSLIGSPGRLVCMLLCFMSWYWGINVRFRGFIRASQGVTHPRFRIAGVEPQPTSSRQPGVVGSSPSTLTMSMTTPGPFSSSSNGPNN